MPNGTDVRLECILCAMPGFLLQRFLRRCLHRLYSRASTSPVGKTLRQRSWPLQKWLCFTASAITAGEINERNNGHENRPIRCDSLIQHASFA
jgi:hypothetical protein